MSQSVIVAFQPEWLIGVLVFAGFFATVLVGSTVASLFQTFILCCGVEKLKLPDPPKPAASGGAAQ